MSDAKAPRLRAARPEDAAAIRRLYAPYVADTAVSFETTPPSEAAVERRIETKRAADQYPWLVCEFDGEVVGYSYGSRFRSREAYQWTVETSVYVADAAQRRRVGRGLYEALFEVLRAQGYLQVVAVMTVPNPASEAFHEAMGFERVGTFESVGFKRGDWHDIGAMQRRLADPAGEPEAPDPVSDVTGTAAWDAAMHAGASRIEP